MGNSRKPLKGILDRIIFEGLESFGRHYSSYRGYVMSNRDLKGMDRLFVYVPHISGRREEGNWAWPKGKSHTSRELPKDGDMVWVEFERGDYRFPIWSFCNQTRKLGLTGEHDPEVKREISEAGHSVEMNDRENYVEITHRDKITKVKLEKDSVTINNNVKIEKDSITFNEGSKGGLINISVLIIKLNALETILGLPLTTIAELEDSSIKH